MKKFVYLILIASFAISLGACTLVKVEPINEVIEPGDKIGDMIVEQSTEIPYQNIWWFCDSMPNQREPVSSTTDCDVPLLSSMDISLSWIAKKTKIASNWDAMTWELYIDDYQIDLERFAWFEYEYIAKGEDNISRDWIITLKNLSPGAHTLRYSWHRTPRLMMALISTSQVSMSKW